MDQNNWNRIEVFFILVLIALQIYFLISAIRKMNMMSTFVTDIKRLRIRRVNIPDTQEHKSFGNKEITYNVSQKDDPDISIVDLRKQPIEDIRKYNKYFKTISTGGTPNVFYFSKQIMTRPETGLFVIRPNLGITPFFLPVDTTTQTLDEIRKNDLYENVLKVNETGNVSNGFRVKQLGKLREDGWRWVVVEKCIIEI